MRPSIARVALPVPLDKQFDYLIASHQFPVIGGRVSVPFGRQTLVGVVTELVSQSEFPLHQLKTIKEVLDDKPVWSDSLYSLLHWCSQFYLYPLGDTLANAMPAMLRKGRAADFTALKEWFITPAGKDRLMTGFGRAVQQAKVMGLLENGPVSHQAMLDNEVSSSVLNTLEDKGWIEQRERQPKAINWSNEVESDDDKPKLNEEQSVAIAAVNSHQSYGCFLLEGVTGSGKTEVYLNMIKPVLEKDRQALVLVPEIGLTPQTINRFKRRFQVPVEVIHSGLNDTERLNAWLAARDKHAGIVIGTRSALLTPFADLGIIIVDEEHDASYKQQDSLRYHARDVAVMRAAKEKIPVVLGSATPALETLHNALTGKYHHLTLSNRAGSAVPTTNKVLDVKGLYLESGLSAPLIAEMRKHLNAGNQVMLFLNRRGYSPALMCHECGWIADCHRCDAYYTFHQHNREMRCHHCGAQHPVIHQCQGCGSTQLVSVGVGTEQLEEQLATLFPDFKAIRIDRDSTRRKGSLETALKAIRNNEYQILIGTQMLAKGHHFPDVTLVGLIDVDSSLYSSDFRASERLAQLFIQVAGRAGRASKAGEVILQTHHPEHQLLQALIHKGYRHFASTALEERKLALLPPYAFLTLFRAEANQEGAGELFLRQVRQTIESHPLFNDECMVLGPMPAPLARRAGKSRWQLMLQAPSRSLMQQLLYSSKPVIDTLPMAKKVRWTTDIEPQDLS
ncbi:Primosome factor n' (replication factor Y) [Vibrio nigripulchritudo SO65]|uniref:primosomal protein N' n=1 Tax=Vibrio nigripulchritudo TaxID=28173 RepID=UPI0003B1B994|nr:primosomal protein N' [Vibrio nigripulchritudo]CCN35136.1 Primosome factor n' (replication factor Y) [Vibrio nigripulchritudo AM115]CCN41729.1 Primosome factor n' (replication factor Y) [Vibrio nigripulchritudo FTn2]CCN65108.1 Primosome factor n' (replication factor Y) [Vibrio nigripulchritudo POn4]CCN75154.1 Primosome factor n' (replication factor Y) [Vibrio nigripulchritudo SO65]